MFEQVIIQFFFIRGDNFILGTRTAFRTLKCFVHWYFVVYFKCLGNGREARGLHVSAANQPIGAPDQYWMAQERKKIMYIYKLTFYLNDSKTAHKLKLYKTGKLTRLHVTEDILCVVQAILSITKE